MNPRSTLDHTNTDFLIDLVGLGFPLLQNNRCLGAIHHFRLPGFQPALRFAP